jgi:Uma2 family endonuclease
MLTGKLNDRQMKQSNHTRLPGQMHEVERMTSLRPRPCFTVGQYLDFDRTTEMRYEYYDGAMHPIFGATESHVLIMVNVVTALKTRLKGRPFRVYPSLMRLKVSRTGLYTYPDTTVVAGKPQFEDCEFDTLLNPTVLIEILSKATEEYDRTIKFEHYRTIDSLAEYIMIAQDAHRVERYVRQPDGQWLFAEFTRLEDVVPLASIGCELKLEEIYDQVELHPEPEETTHGPEA